MITGLTHEQENMIDVFVDKYVQVGLSVEPITEAACAKARDFIYAQLNKFPAPFIICDGPISAWDAVCEAATPADVVDRQRLLAELKQHIIFPALDGNLDADFFAFAEYMKYIGVELPQTYEDYRCLIDVHLVWPLDELCVFSQRPMLYRSNAAGFLDCDFGPAIEYKNDVKIWAIEDVIVDEQIVMHPETQTIEQIFSDDNADRRSIRIERFGWVRLLGQTKAKCLDEGENVVEGTWEALYEMKGEHRFVATCATGRIVTMGVPRDIKTCREAQIWLRGEESLNIIART